ncbi:MAG: sugar phosphate isomerase/epimerase family protein [Balneolales bacterium]
MIKVGFNLLAWSAVVSDDLMPVTEKLKGIGYEGIECFVGASEDKAYKRLGDHVRNNLNMEVTCVTTLGPDENPISPSAQIRLKGLDRLKWAIDRAHDMNAEFLCGPFHSAFATFANKAPEEQEYEWSAEVLSAAGDYAAQAGIMLTPEAVNRFECYLCNTMEQLVNLVQRVGHPNVRAHFDTHHANIEEKKMAEAIHKVAPVLGHVHISESDRGTPGEGQALWDEAFATLAEIEYDGWLTIEAFTRNDPDFANSINVWREYSQPWDVAEKGFSFIKEMCNKHGLK